jgi:hypothetical protein
MSAVFWFFMGVMFTVAVAIVVSKIINHNKYIVPLKEILSLVKEGDIKFEKRLADIVYFTGYKDYSILCNLRKKELSVFDGDECLIVGHKASEDITNEIIEKLTYDNYNKIYKDISVINGVAYSNNLISNENPYKAPPHKVDNKETKAMVEFVLEEDEEEYDDDSLSIDNILHKMEKFGMDSLTDEEKEFIKDTGNWKL